MKQVNSFLILTAVLVLITAPIAHAVPNAAVLYLRVAAGARPAGMGEAFVSIADDATATYWNPAGLGNAPLSGKFDIIELPEEYGTISDAVTMKNIRGDIETWVIAGSQLLMYNGKTWTSGKDYLTSSDQTIYDFLRTIVSTEDDQSLRAMADLVVRANYGITRSEVETFAERVRANVPDGYADADDLKQGLERLITGYDECRMSTENFRTLQNKLRDGLKDSVMTSQEVDKITFSLDQAVLRFLPSRLVVPYSAGIRGSLTCLAGTGMYLWVGTDDGLYRLAGQSLARFSAGNDLPSDTILTMAVTGEHLMIGTSQGVVEYFHGGFTPFPNAPRAPVTAIAFNSATDAYAAIGGVIFHFDGAGWSESFPYTVRIDDTMERIVERVAIYHTPSEYEYLTQRIRALNERNVPAALRSPVPAGDTAAAALPAEADRPPGDENVDDSTLAPGTAPVVESESAPVESEEPAADPWLVEGNIIQLPYGPRFRYDISDMTVDLYNTLWVGTTAGLLAFEGQSWKAYGYVKFIVPPPDSTGGGGPLTARQIAERAYWLTDSAQIDILAANIDDLNELNGRAVAPREEVFVYRHNIGAAIYSLGLVYGELHVGTEYSLEKKTAAGWQPIRPLGMRRQQMIAAYDFEGQAYYIGRRGIGLESKGRKEFVVMFVKWLPSLDVDMYYGFVSYVHHARGLGTFGLSAIYLNYGAIQFTDETGQDIGEGHPFELTLVGSFGTSLNSNIKMGGSVKFIHSRLSEQGVGMEQGEGIASAFAVDAGILYRFTDRFQFGAAVTNVGPDIKYVDAAQSDPLPRNLAVGLSYNIWDTPYNRLTVQAELNKMLVDLDRSLRREMENAIRHFGAEYWYSNLIALRAGYKYDKEGEVKHPTFGAGLQYQAARFDMAYIPSSVDSPLANTLRISFSLIF